MASHCLSVVLVATGAKVQWLLLAAQNVGMTDNTVVRLSFFPRDRPMMAEQGDASLLRAFCGWAKAIVVGTRLTMPALSFPTFLPLPDFVYT